MDDDRPGPVRIGELSRRTGVSAPLLRAWERRYGLLRPRRTDGGFRVYGAADERRVRGMRARIDQGLSASLAAAAVLADEQSGPGPVARGPDEIRAAMSDALERFDERAAHAAIDRLLGTFSLEAALSGGVLPYLGSLGARWESGAVSIAQEHFATSIIRGRLLALARNWGDGHGPLALLACPSGEQHDLGLICFGLGLRERGWRILLLGPNTPVGTIEETAGRLAPDLTVIAAMQPGLLEAEREGIARMAARHPVALAGPGAGADLARDTGARSLDQAPMAAAARVDATLRPATGRRAGPGA